MIRTIPSRIKGYAWLPLLFVLYCVIAPAHAAEDHPAQRLVVETSNKMLAKLKEERELIRKSPGRIYALVSDILLPHFDFEQSATLVLGKHWRSATPAQRSRFVEEFRNLLVRTYATSLTEYTDRKITYLPFREAPGAENVTVRTQIDQPGAFPIPINYDLHQKDGGWKVYDVVIDNVSLVSNYRTSFSKDIREKGLDALIDSLAKRNLQAAK